MINKTFLTLVSLAACASAARILAVFSVPSISHQVVFRPLTQELAKRGHDVVVITPNPAFPKGQAPPNLTEVHGLHDEATRIWRRVSKDNYNRNPDVFRLASFSLTKISLAFEAIMQNEQVKNIVFGKSRFDLLLIQSCVPAALSLSHVLKIPVIEISSTAAVEDELELLGAPKHPILYPGVFRQRLYNLTFMEKAKELYNWVRFQLFTKTREKADHVILQKLFGPNIPPVSELKKKIEMLFLNVSPMWSGNQPIPPNVLYIGGIQKQPMRELPTDLKSYLDSSKHGVVYVSFGSNVKPSLLPPESIQIMVNVLSKLPYDVLWKWDLDELPGRTKNIKIHKWVPQSDLLRHPKIKLFVTQGGLQSTEEAINAGVPLIGLPILNDQWYNTEQYVRFGIGVRLDINAITEDTFKTAIDTVSSKSYRDAILNLRDLMEDQMQPALDRAVWWTEYVIRHKGAKELRAAGAFIHWTEYYEVRFLSILLSIVLILLVLLYMVVKFLLRLMWRFVSRRIKIKME